MRWWVCVGLTGVMSAVWGCQQDKEPPPRTNAGIQVEGRTLLPMPVPNRKYDKGIVAQAASEDQAAAHKPETEPGTEQVKVDDSTPDGVVDAYIEIINRGAFIQLPSILVAEQQEVARGITEAMAGMMPALKALETKWHEKFPDAPIPQGMAGAPGMLNTNPLSKESVESIDDSSAQATVQAQGAPEPLKLTLHKVESAWRVQDPHIPSAEQFEQMRQILEVFPKMTEAINGVVQKIDSGELASAADAGQALQQSVQEALGPARIELMQKMAEQMKQAVEQGVQQGVSGTQTPPAEAQAPPPAQPPAQPPPQQKPRERERDDVDNVYSGPGQLRAR